MKEGGLFVRKRRTSDQLQLQYRARHLIHTHNNIAAHLTSRIDSRRGVADHGLVGDLTSGEKARRGLRSVSTGVVGGAAS